MTAFYELSSEIRRAAPVEEKHYAAFRLKEEVLKTAISKGADVAIQNAPQIWTGLRDLYRWLPADWKSGA